MNAFAPTPSIPVMTIGLIQQQVADHFRMPVEALRSQRRCTRIARPRQVAMYLASVLLPMRSLPYLGRAFQRDHTTVLHGINKVTDLMRRNATFRGEVEAIRHRLVETAYVDPTRDMALELAEDTAAALREALKLQALADPAGFVGRILGAAGLFDGLATS